MLKELELIETNELLKELQTRFDAYIFQGIRKQPKGNGYDDYKADWQGGAAACIGLCDILKCKIKAELMGEE